MSATASVDVAASDERAPAAAGWMRLGRAAQRSGRLEVAQAAYLRVLACEPRNVDALCLLALVVQQRGESGTALTIVRRALALRENSVTLCLSGSLLRATGDSAAAVAAYRRALELCPDDAEIVHELALALADDGRLADAEAAYRRALVIRPAFVDAHNNLGVLYKQSGRPDAAEAAYRAALAIDPEYPEAYNNLGVLYKESGRLALAEPAYRRAIELRPDYADARWNLGLVLLTLGNYAEGWAYYEARYHAKRSEAVSVKPDLPFPQWQGEPIAGRSLLVWSEQGHGDYIQFARFLPLLKARGVARLTVACAPPLAPLLATVDGVDAVVTSRKALAAHDYWVFVLSLPALLATSIATLPAELPYVRALPERFARWQSYVGSSSRKVGLVWKGNPGHSNDAHRSLASLSVLLPLWSVAGVRFYSLQKGCGEDEAQSKVASASQPITALGDEIADFADSAAIVAALDLVICVDTAIAHVAGALGKPCWVLLPNHECDWRWQRGRDDTPWYPGAMRLFREDAEGGWAATIARLADDLRRWAAADAVPPGSD